MAKTSKPAPALEQSLRVRALREGVIGANLVHKGETFTLSSEQAFAPSWMERVAMDVPDNLEARRTKAHSDVQITKGLTRPRSFNEAMAAMGDSPELPPVAAAPVGRSAEQAVLGD